MPVTSNAWLADFDRWLKNETTAGQTTESQPANDGSPMGHSLEKSPLFGFEDDIESTILLGNRLREWLNSQAGALGELLDSVEVKGNRIRERLTLLLKMFSARLHRATLDSDETPVSAMISDDYSASNLPLLTAGLYKAVFPYSLPEIEGLLLQTLAWPRTDNSLGLLIGSIVDFPPHAWSATAMGLSPLMRTTNWSVKMVFPRLLQALHQPTAVASILDLGNYCYRKKMVDLHPIQQASLEGRLEDSLTQMLGGVVARLGMLEENPTQFGSTPAKIQQVLSDAVSLCVALCDTLGLLHYQPAIGKLYQAVSLRHRRIQIEAAAALAQLNQHHGREKLVELAAEPIVRLRALAYAEELELTDKIDAKYSAPSAIAEAELAHWLAQPQQMGLPPRSIELIDQRLLFWPSYTTPRDCFLFRFEYPVSHGTWSNIGIAGPMIHAFEADLAELPIADIYAAFAGWQAEHPEIYELPPNAWNSIERRAAEERIAFLESRGFSEVRALWLGCFIGELCLVVECRSSEHLVGVAVTDGLEAFWYPTQGRQRPLGPSEAYAIFKGRKMLRTFNPRFEEEIETE